MRLYNITHSADIDGMSSAAFLVRYWKLPLQNILFYGHEKKRMPYLQEQLGRLNPKDGLFIITDIGINKEALIGWQKLLELLASRNNRVVWIDHHVWPDEWVSMLSRYCDIMIIRESKSYCAAEMVLRELCNDRSDTDFKRKLAGFAHLSDFNIQTKDKRVLLRLYKHAWAIRYFNGLEIDSADRNLRKVIAHLARGEYESALVDIAYTKYKRHADRQIALMLNSAKVAEIRGMKVCIGFAEGLHSTTACYQMLKAFRPKIAIYVNTAKGNSRIHIRSVAGVDSSVVAFAWNGGGHPQASAAKFDPRKYAIPSSAGREKLCKDLEKSIEKNYSKIIR